MDLLIDMRSNHLVDLRLGDIWRKLIEVVIDAWSAMIMHLSFIAHDTCPHAQHIILLALLPTIDITFQLELTCLEIVTRIKLIADGKRYDMKLLQPFHGSARSAHRHHLQDSLLGTVVGILGPSFTLRNPYIVVLLVDHEVHIVRQPFAGHEHLAWRKGAFYDERLIHTYQILHPRQGEEIVTDGNLTGGIKAIVDK